MKQQVTIQALNLQGSPIGGFKNVICLYLNSIDDPCPIHCTEERENGIYVFTIDEGINTLSQVFVQLSQDKPLQEKIGSTYQTITYLKKPYFSHPTCMQINTLECMIHNDKIVPYTFAPYGKSPIVAMLKAYKLPISSQAYPIGCEFANTLQAYKEDWRNEIYTIDSEQTIRLQAFVGNTAASKTIQEDMAEIDVSQIKWGYTLIKAGAKQSLDEYPVVYKERDITPLKDKSGTNILFSLKEIAQAYQPNTSPYVNDGENIVVFAYVKDNVGRILHLDYKNTVDKQGTIQSIELKILSSRFYLHYDGEILEFLENERVLCAIEERAQDTQKNLGQEIALLLRRHIQHKADSNTSSHISESATSESATSESAHPTQADHILQDGAYTLSHEDSMFELFKQASYSPYLSPEARHSIKALLDEYAKPLSSLKSLELVVAYNKDIIIETERYYEDTNLTASRFRIRVRNPNLLKCPSHKGISESSLDSEIRECKDCQALRELTQWDNHYFLERGGYDCITPDFMLRIPEGRYELRWRYSGVSLSPTGEFAKLIRERKLSSGKKPLLNLSNHYISPKRGIMLHQGTAFSDTKGCLLFGEKLQPDENGSSLAIQKKHSSPLANKLLNFLIQDERVREVFKQTKDDKIGLAIPNVSFIIRNKFGKEGATQNLDQGLMVLEVVRKWEYRGGGSNNADNWATISEFELKLDNEIVKDSSNQEIKGYIVEPAGANPNPKRPGHNLPPERQQKESGSDTRIPAGEYEIFWRPSGKKVKKDGEFLGELPVELKDDFAPELRALNGTNMGSRKDILIHIGNTGHDSLGCLMPNKTYENNVAGDSAEMTEKLIGAIIRHDPQSYINATQTNTRVRTNENVVKNFKIVIREENIEINQ